jgi:SPP1 gp7 family putative phage head morphogenesis protein
VPLGRVTVQLDPANAPNFVDLWQKGRLGDAIKQFGQRPPAGRGRDASSLGATPNRDPRETGYRGAYPRVGRHPPESLLERLADEVGLFGPIVETWADETWGEGFTVESKKDKAWAEKANKLIDDSGLKDAFHDSENYVLTRGRCLLHYRLASSDNTPSSPPGKVTEILEVTALAPSQVSRIIKEENVKDPRFGEVLAVELQLSGAPVRVDASRVQLLIEKKDPKDRTNGIPRLRRVLDDVLGGENMKWSSFETFYQRAAPVLQAVIDPNAKLQDDDAERIKTSLDALVSGTTQKILAESFELKVVSGASSIVSPTPYWELVANSLAFASRIPKAILFGDAAGALSASSEDKKRWTGRVSRRHSRYATACVKDFITKATKEWKLLTPAPDDLKIVFPNLDEPSFAEKTDAELKRADALTKFRAAQAAPPDWLVEYTPGKVPRDPNAPDPSLLPPAPGEPPGQAPPGKVPAARQPAPTINQPIKDGVLDAKGAMVTFPIFRYALERSGRDFEQLPEPGDLAPVRRRHQHAIEGALLAMMEEFLEVFETGRDQMDPNDPLVKALLALEPSSRELERALYELLLEAGLLGGNVGLHAFGFGQPFDWLDDTTPRVFKTIARSTGASQAAQLTQAIRRSITEGLLNGEGPQALRGRITAIFDTGLSSAELIARTESLRAFNAGAREAIRVIGGTEFRFRAFDSACPVCAPLDGQVFSIDDADHVPPLHPRCRCQLQAVLERVLRR